MGYQPSCVELRKFRTGKILLPLSISSSKIRYYDGVVNYYERMIMSGGRKAWIMRLNVFNQEVDQREHGSSYASNEESENEKNALVHSK